MDMDGWLALKLFTHTRACHLAYYAYMKRIPEPILNNKMVKCCASVAIAAFILNMHNFSLFTCVQPAVNMGLAGRTRSLNKTTSSWQTHSTAKGNEVVTNLTGRIFQTLILMSFGKMRRCVSESRNCREMALETKSCCSLTKSSCFGTLPCRWDTVWIVNAIQLPLNDRRVGLILMTAISVTKYLYIVTA